MLTGDYRDLFAAIATSAAALTGLLFVVVTVAERRDQKSLPAVVQEVRAAAALLSFMNALTVSLFSLEPGTNAGYPALVVGLIGLLFSAAAMRSFLGFFQASLPRGQASPTPRSDAVPAVGFRRRSSGGRPTPPERSARELVGVHQPDPDRLDLDRRGASLGTGRRQGHGNRGLADRAPGSRRPQGNSPPRASRLGFRRGGDWGRKTQVASVSGSLAGRLAFRKVPNRLDREPC